MTNLFENYKRSELEIVRGDKNTVYDKDGNAYLDLTSGIGVANLGYNHPTLTQALHEQVDKIWHVPNLYESEIQEEVAAKLIGDYDYKAFFCNSGAEANEAAIKLARIASGKSKIVTFYNGFHGRTFGAMAATAQEKIQKGFGEMLTGFEYLEYNAPGFEEVIDENTAAVMLEVVQGEGGVLVADRDWLTSLAVHAKAVGALLIIDEVQTGIGRTGSLYAWEQFDIDPDIITIAKGLGNGVPVGAMLGKAAIAPALSPGTHGTTFGGNKLALSVATKVLDIVKLPTFSYQTKIKGETLTKKLEALGLTVRGLGLMIGIEMETPERLAQVFQKLREQKVLALTAGTTTLRLLPSLTITKDEIDHAVDAIKEAING
ncbi:MAG: acetylornithine/succinylornithine family transaminase [Lactobacillales bacterium]|jgi:acetylornithine aminotransferase|nr:acetylornithine/succinylornithine family transaminase [Lactobacillales bacterium]